MTAIKGTFLVLASAALVALLSACTVRRTEAPALTGPSEFGLSVTVSATPDAVTQDGQSSSLITIIARDASGQPRPNVGLRLDILVGEELSDFPAISGTLSARNVVTGPDGRATATYTAPTSGSPANGACSSVTAVASTGCVRVAVTPLGSGFDTAASQTVQIRLLPQNGGSAPPSSVTPVPNFTIVPGAPAANALTQFDATQSCASALVFGVCPTDAGRIASYSWSFGDGGSGSGQLASYRYQLAGSFLVTLTVTNDRGVSASLTRSITVGAGSLPTAGFLFSPTPVQVGIPVNFDAGPSRPATGHRIVEYKWNWGDGQPVESSGSSTIKSHTFTSAGVYTVILTVIDESGQTGLASQVITVTAGPGATPPTASFLFSPTPVSAGSAVYFNATGSRAAAGRSLIRYEWNWGDGSGVEISTTPLRDHTFAVAGKYSVVLTVYDDTGLPGSSSQEVTVGGVPGGTPPTSEFVFSPTPVRTNASVFFDASASKAGAGHTIVRYDWNWGDGSPIDSETSPLRSHIYSAAAAYTVVLTVVDEIGQSSLVSKTVTVNEAPTATFRSSPTNPIVGQAVNFDASESKPAIGRTIVKYEWNWGDGSQSGPLTSPLANHTYATSQTFIVILTVTDDLGITGIVTGNVNLTVPAGP